jgi:hypothetical protein
LRRPSSRQRPPPGGRSLSKCLGPERAGTIISIIPIRPILPRAARIRFRPIRMVRGSISASSEERPGRSAVFRAAVTPSATTTAIRHLQGTTFSRPAAGTESPLERSWCGREQSRPSRQQLRHKIDEGGGLSGHGFARARFTRHQFHPKISFETADAEQLGTLPRPDGSLSQLFAIRSSCERNAAGPIAR